MAVRIADNDSRAYWRAKSQEISDAYALWEAKQVYRGPPPVDLGEARIVEPLSLPAPAAPE